MAEPVYETDRLIIRGWKDSDRDPFAKMNADPKVMEFFTALRTREQSDNLVDICISQMREHGFCFWAVERKDTNQFIGFTGLNSFDANLPFCPCVEIGWRLAHEQWGNGFATEAAMASLDIGFNQCELSAIVSFTTVNNMRSRHVMSKIGMSDTADNFLYPDVSEDSGLQEHCLYKISKDQYSGLEIVT